MPSVEIDPGDSARVVIYVNHLEADLMQVLPGSRFDKKRSTHETLIYTAPLSWGSCVGLRGLFPDDLQIGPLLTEWALQERQKRIDPCMAVRQLLDVPGQFDQRLKPFQRADIAFLGIAERAVLGNDMGCIAGDAEISYNRFGATRKRSLRWFAERFSIWNDNNTYVKSLMPDGTLRLNRVVAVISQGFRETVLIELASGRSIRCTPDHEIAVPGSWVRADHLSAGDFVLSNGKVSQGFIDKDGYVRVSCPGHPRANRTDHVYEHILVMEAHLGRPVVFAEHIHHKNEDRSDNRISNLEILTPTEHLKRHDGFKRLNGGTSGTGGRIWFIPEEDEIVSIKPSGLIDTYDLVMAEPARNFVANGVIVHNCGKTVAMISTLRWLSDYGHNVFPACVITTSSTKLPWRDHWLEWWPFALPIVIDGTPAVRRKQFEQVNEHVAAGDPVVCIINWEAVRLHSKLAPYGSVRMKKCVKCGGTDETISIAQCHKHPKELNAIEWRSVVADEVHKMADPTSQQTRAVWAVQHRPSVRYSYGMSGTIGEDPGRIWAPLHGVAPMDYPTRTAYVDRYCLQTWSTFGEWKIIGLQPATRDEFFKVFNTRFRRVPIQLAAPYLPPVVRSTRNAEMGTAQKKAYVSMKQEGHVLGEDVDSSIIVKNNLEKQTRLLQLSAATCVVDGGKVKLAMPSSKVTELASVLEELGSAQFIACTVNRGLIDLVAAKLDELEISYRVLVGGMSAMEKEANRKDFQEGRAQCLLFTMGAGGEGLDMTAAGTMIRLQRSWSLVQNLQTERRFWRIGSERHQQLNLIDIVVPGTEEVRQLRVVKQKLARLEAINQDIAVIMANGGLDQARLASLQAEQQAIMAADDLTQEIEDGDGPEDL